MRVLVARILIPIAVKLHLGKTRFIKQCPLRRILVSFAGPFFNLVFAVLVLSLIWGIGFEVRTLGNRIVLLSELSPGERYPADDAGLKTGDRIVAINGRQTSWYHEVQENIAVNPENSSPLPLNATGNR